MADTKRTIKLITNVLIYVLLSYVSIHSLALLNIRLSDIFNINTYLILFNEKVVPLMVSIITTGIAIAFLVVATRETKKTEGLVISLVSSSVVAALVFLEINYDFTMYFLASLFYVFGIFLSVFFMHDKKIENARAAFVLGHSTVKYILYVVAIGAFIGSFFVVSSDTGHYKNSFKDNIKNLVSSDSGFKITKEQIKPMLESQLNSNSTVTKEQIRPLVKRIDEFCLNRTNLSNEEKERIIEQETENVYKEAIKANKGRMNASEIDRIAEEIANRMNQADERKKLAGNINSMIDNMPIIKVFYRFLPHIIAITVFTAVLIAELFASLVSGIILVIDYLAFMRKNIEEKKSKKKPEEDISKKTIIN